MPSAILEILKHRFIQRLLNGFSEQRRFASVLLLRAKVFSFDFDYQDVNCPRFLWD